MMKIYTHDRNWKNEKEITEAQAIEMLGADIWNQRKAEAFETYNDDPMTSCTWMDGMEIVIEER